MFQNDYPYTDFHELNLDFVLDEMSKTRELNKETLEAVAEAKTSAVSAAASADKAMRNGFSKFLNNEFIGRRIRSDAYTSAQGMLARIENGTTVIYTCWTDYNEPNETSVIEKIDVNGNVLATSQPMSLHHSNDMCTDGTYIYVSGYNHTNIYKIDFGTLTLVDTITVSVPVQSITYDTDRDIFYLYTSYGGYHLYKCDNDFSNVEHLADYDEHYGVETIEYHDNAILFIENAPNTVTAISAINYEKIGVSFFADFMSNYYPIGEMQAISFYEDDYYICMGKPRQRSTYDDSYEIGYTIAAYGLGNIKLNQTFLTRYMASSLTKYTGTATVNQNLFVFKPLGTAAEPFYNAGDISIVMDAPLYTPVLISLESDVTDELSLFNKDVHIKGNDHTLAKCSLDLCRGTIEYIVLTEGSINHSQFDLWHVTGNVNYKYCALVTRNVPDAINLDGLTQIGFVNVYKELFRTTGSGSESMPSFKPKYILCCVFDNAAFQATQIMPYAVVVGVSMKTSDYNITITETTISGSSISGKQIRVYGLY